MTQLIGHNSEGNSFIEPVVGVRYWVETLAPSKQVLMRKAPSFLGKGAVILTAPVVILTRTPYGTPKVEYLNEDSTEKEIEAFTRKYTLDTQQSKWCFAALEELSPVVGEES